ncbi:MULTISPECIES: helix-turn-helix domain-containing protein [unclassified Pseudomonas]|uniref:GlxA family transcriptional regulator n=2 Tax=Pseudomonas TaxID=286 RepID=UPI00244C71D0|nr:MULTISPECIES: helix-turn-helix domain-containing protein [unclassified Pseudomonas]MDH0481307.1 helix-turn-helix domain-containing protein [Pseudomonas sp. GD04015]MDH0605214.1 helix-turn-helix domain-containing protein [Pseudomonas sp. GD03869]
MMRIALYTCPQTVLSSLSMADDAFRLANQLAGEALFEVLRVSADGAPVRSGYAELRVDGDLGLAEGADLLLIPATGSALQRTLDGNAVLLAWLARRPTEQGLASLCSSACLLAAAGVLDGRRATTHWALAETFRRHFPRVDLRIDELFTEDANRYCSGGAQAGLDLCLHLIARHGGDWLAERVAATLVVERERGSQARFAPLLPAAGQDDPLIAPLLRWLQRHHAEPIDLPGLAARAHCSTRTLLRRFRAATGLTPHDYLQRVRISAAQTALRHPGRSLEQVAAQVGYADRASFAKRFKQLCGETPGAWRKRLRQG